MADRKIADLPGVPSKLDSGLRTLLQGMRDHIRELRGLSGDGSRRALTAGEGGGNSTTIIVPGGGGDGGSSEPDLTPPPSPSGVVCTAGMSYVMVETAAPTFTEGHGYARTLVYGAKWPTSAPTAPTFSDAVLVHEFVGQIGAFPTDLGTRWCLWLKWLTVDGRPSTDPAGGTNGFQVTTGLVGTSDLGAAIVLSQNLAPGSVTADKSALDIGGDNLLANNSFELDVDGDGIGDGWAVVGSEAPVPTRQPGRISGYCQRLTWAGANTGDKAVTQSNASNASWGVRGGWLAGRTYVISFYARADTAKAVGCTLLWPTQAPASTTVLKNPNLATTWQRYAFRVTWGGTVEPNGRCRFGCATGAAITGYLEFDDVQVEEGDTLSGYQGKLATNTIVAGDGAIANLAITNALIANLAVDDAKIASLVVSKLLAGNLSVGQYIRSTSYVPGLSGWAINADGTAEFAAASIRGQLTAAQINGRGLTIRRQSDNAVIIDAGASVPIDFSMVNPAPNWLNPNLFQGGLTSPSGLVGGASVAASTGPEGAQTAVNVTIPANGAYPYYQLTGLQPGFYTIKLQALVTNAHSLVVASTDDAGWTNSQWTRATTASGAAVWVEVAIRQYTGTGILDVAVGAYLGPGGDQYTTPASTVIRVANLTINREGFAGDLNASAGLSLVNSANVTIGGSTVTKSGGVDGAWDAGFYSKDSFVGGAFVSWVCGSEGSYGVGLNTDPVTDASYTSVDFWFYCDSGHSLYAFNNGTLLTGVLGTWAVGDVLAVVYDGSNVRYLKNGAVLFTQAAATTSPLYADSSFNTMGSKITNVQFGPLSSNAWAAIGGAGKPQDNATVGATIGTNLSGNFNQTTFDIVMNGQALIRGLHVQEIYVSTMSRAINGGSVATGGIALDGNRIDGYNEFGQLQWRLGLQ